MPVVVAGVATAAAAWCAAASRASTRRAGLRLPPGAGRVLAGAGSAAVLLCAYLVRVPVGVLTISAAIAVVVAALVPRHLARSRRAAVDADVVTLCFGMAAEVRAGRMPAEALASSAAQLIVLRDDIAAAARAAGRGAALDIELYTLAGQLRSTRLATVAAVLAAGVATGARVADVMERVAIAFDADDEARADVNALAAAPRATATVLSILPLFGVVLATTMGSHPLALLLHTPIGGLLVGGALLLDGGGLLWVRAITGRALRG